MDKKQKLARDSVKNVLLNNGYTPFNLKNFDDIVSVCSGYYIVTLSSMMKWLQDPELMDTMWDVFEAVIVNLTLVEAQTEMVFRSNNRDKV